MPSPLVEAIFQRQCTRADYDGQPPGNDVLKDLERAADRNGVRAFLLTERAKIESVIEYVTQASSAHMRDPAFIWELKHWIRFDDSQAVSTGDGLAARSSGNPTSPSWIGGPLFSLFFREKSENDRYAKPLSISRLRFLPCVRLSPDGLASVRRAPAWSYASAAARCCPIHCVGRSPRSLGDVGE